MTPIKDYAYHLRQRLIKDRRTAEQQHYQELIAKGLTETDAANMSGWHPLIPVDKFFRATAWYLIVCCVAGLLAIWVSSSHALMDARDAAVGAKVSEEILIDLFNGETVTLSDGTRWGCMKLMEVRK